jgi:F420H(2)-dependent quinone reductase
MNHSLRDTGMPIVAVTTRGARSGKLRKNPVMRVTDGSAYAVVASKSGSDEHCASKSRRHRQLTRTKRRCCHEAGPGFRR